jgi:hypothetical protein
MPSSFILASVHDSVAFGSAPILQRPVGFDSHVLSLLLDHKPLSRSKDWTLTLQDGIVSGGLVAVLPTSFQSIEELPNGFIRIAGLYQSPS